MSVLIYNTTLGVHSLAHSLSQQSQPDVGTTPTKTSKPAHRLASTHLMYVLTVVTAYYYYYYHDYYHYI